MRIEDDISYLMRQWEKQAKRDKELKRRKSRSWEKIKDRIVK